MKTILLLVTAFVSCQGSDESCRENAVDEEVCNQKKSARTKQEQLKETLAGIKWSCGELCDTSMVGKPGEFFDFIEKQIDCDALFGNDDIDKPGTFLSPPSKIPKYLLPQFTYDGRVKLIYEYFDDNEGKTHYLHWHKNMLDSHIRMFEEHRLHGPYGQPVVEDINRHVTKVVNVKDKHVLVIGSQMPWVETILLMANAKRITTLDYLKIETEWPNHDTMTPSEMAEQYLNRTLPKFEVIVSFSSLEHSGLGR